MKLIFTDALKKTYKEQYYAAQPIPYIHDKGSFVDRVFVAGCVQKLIGGNVWDRLETYRSIFTDSRKNRRIIEGEPGYGKSTLTRELAYDWCIGKKDSPLHAVDNLILLQLGQKGKFTNIDAAIKMLLLSKEPRIKESDINIIMKHFTSTEIVLDGYDEYPQRDNGSNDEIVQMIRYETMKDIAVTLTTRYPPREYDKSNTQRIRLKGFDDSARDEYIRKIVSGPRKEETVNKMKGCWKDNPILDYLCQIPFFFVLFVHMTQERENCQKFKSVTEFIKYMINCFHEHQKNKSQKHVSYPYNIMYETDYEQLSKVAFEGLNQENQQLLWNKEYMFKRLGKGLYHHYVAIGVLVEERQYDENGQAVTMVKFYHKIFQEWYASYILLNVVCKSEGSFELDLKFLDPTDCQFLYLFACGIEPKAGKKIINHLKKTADSENVAILCTLEWTNEVNDMQEAIEELCPETLATDTYDSYVLRWSILQLLYMTRNYDVSKFPAITE